MRPNENVIDFTLYRKRRQAPLSAVRSSLTTRLGKWSFMRYA